MSREHMPGLEFDARPILAELETKRARAKLSWRQVARAVGVSPTTFTRLYRGHAPDAVTLGRILFWLGRKPDWMR